MAEHGFGMIGCGMIAEFHTRAIAEIPGARVVAVYDTVAPKATIQLAVVRPATSNARASGSAALSC